MGHTCAIVLACLLCTGCVSKDARLGKRTRAVNHTAGELQTHNGFNDWLETKILILVRAEVKAMLMKHWGEVLAGLMLLERANKEYKDRRSTNAGNQQA
jgi:hypothetical protein